MSDISLVAKFLKDDINSRLSRNSHVMMFAQKVLAVLLGEVLSSTVYEIITVIMVGGGTLTNAQGLIARSIYAVLITIYSPAMSWFLSKKTAGKNGFFAIILQSHANVCPVLQAWGWKNFAAQLDTWAGTELWDEIVVAVVVTALLLAAQVTSGVQKAKENIAKGGDADTLMARYLALPSSGGLIAGYVWNVVATWVVGKVQGQDASYHFDFFIQGGYAVIACTTCTALTMLLKRRMQHPKTSPTETRLEQLNSWAGLETAESSVKQLVGAILSFIYAWALLDTADDWAFGVMNHCASYSSCSYQSNWVYAIGVTVVFSASSTILDKAKGYVKAETVIAESITLQINAMVLTVGWAWMNFYSTLMSAATGPSAPEIRVLLYVQSLIVLGIFHSLTQYVLQTAHRAFVQEMKEALAVFEGLEKGEAKAAEDPTVAQKNASEL